MYLATQLFDANPPSKQIKVKSQVAIRSTHNNLNNLNALDVALTEAENSNLQQ